MTDQPTFEPTEPRERSLLARIFVSPDERRLRAGWRLILHTILLIVLVFGLVGVVGIVAFMLGYDPDSLSNPGSSPNDRIIELVFISFIVLAITLATWIARRFLDRRSFGSLGFQFNRHTLLDLLFGIGLGGLLMLLMYGFESLMGWLTFEGWAWETTSGGLVASGLISALLLYICVGYYEELVSRGYHLQNVRDGLNLPLGLVLSSAVFGLLHITNPGANLMSTLGIFFAGFFLAYGWIRTRQLWIPIGLHIGWNFFQGTIFGFEVSGTPGFHLIQQAVGGPVFITGGAFGPEGGIISWAAMLIGVGLMWLYTRGRQSVSAEPTTLSSTQEQISV